MSRCTAASTKCAPKPACAYVLSRSAGGNRSLGFRDPERKAGFKFLAGGKNRGAGRRRSKGAAGAGGRWIACIAKTNCNAVDWQLHRLGGNLGKDRVGAGADIGHRQLHGQPAVSFEAGARGRTPQNVTADRGSDAETDEPATVADAGRLCNAFVPSEAGGTLAQRFSEMARGERNVPLGIAIRVVS